MRSRWRNNTRKHFRLGPGPPPFYLDVHPGSIDVAGSRKWFGHMPGPSFANIGPNDLTARLGREAKCWMHGARATKIIYSLARDVAYPDAVRLGWLKYRHGPAQWEMVHQTGYQNPAGSGIFEVDVNWGPLDHTDSPAMFMVAGTAGTRTRPTSQDSGDALQELGDMPLGSFADYAGAIGGGVIDLAAEGPCPFVVHSGDSWAGYGNTPSTGDHAQSAIGPYESAGSLDETRYYDAMPMQILSDRNPGLCSSTLGSGGSTFASMVNNGWIQDGLDMFPKAYICTGGEEARDNKQGKAATLLDLDALKAEIDGASFPCKLFVTTSPGVSWGAQAQNMRDWSFAVAKDWCVMKDAYWSDIYTPIYDPLLGRQRDAYYDPANGSHTNVAGATELANTYYLQLQDHFVNGSAQAFPYELVDSPTDHAFTHTPDCVVGLTLSGVMPTVRHRLTVRSTWHLDILPDGSLDLVEDTTSRATAPAATVSTGTRIVLMADDERIAVFADGATAIDYGSAASNKTNTSGNLEQQGAGNVSYLLIFEWVAP